MAAVPPKGPLAPNAEFAKLPSDARIATAAKRLEENGIRVIVARSAAEAKEAVRRLVPAGSEVFDSTSRTLEKLGLAEEFRDATRYRSVRNRIAELSQKGEKEDARRLGAAPDYIVGSVHAVTEEGHVLIASMTGSQLAPYASGAAHVIWVVGAQKVVADLPTALRRLREYSYPLEDARAREAYGVPSGLNKILIVQREFQPGRATLVLVRESLGF